MALTKRRRQMFSLVEAHRRGGLSKKAFCQKHGVALSTFSWWQHEYRKSDGRKDGASEPSTFMPVAGPVAGASVEYRFSDGSMVRIPCSVGQSTLVSILHVLREQSCSA